MRRNLVQISNAAFTVIALSISVLLHAASSSIMDSMDEICVSEVDCYPKLFSPTHEFKVIRPGQILPPGLHVRVDMQTMEKSAKINVVGEGEENGSIILSTTEDGKVIQQEESTAMGGGGGAVIHGKDPVSSSNSDKMYSNYRTSKLPLQERDAFGKLIEKMLEKSENEIMEILEKLEEIVHEIDWGMEFISTPQGIPTITKLLSHNSTRIRTKAALVLGSSLQNNPSVQTLVLEAEVLPLLYIRLQLEGEMKTVNRLVYALAGFVRSFERGIHRFLETEGLSRLLAVYRKTASEPGIREKIIVLLLDLINPDMLHHDLEEEKGDDSNKAARALSTVIDWFPTIDLEQWCLALEPVAVENDGTSAKELLKAFKAALEKRIQEEL